MERRKSGSNIKTEHSLVSWGKHTKNGAQMMASQCFWSAMMEQVPQDDPASHTVVTLEALSSMWG